MLPAVQQMCTVGVSKNPCFKIFSSTWGVAPLLILLQYCPDSIVSEDIFCFLIFLTFISSFNFSLTSYHLLARDVPDIP